MPRTPREILLEADEWQSVTEACFTLNGALGSIGDDAMSAAHNAIGALARGDIAAAMSAQADALGSIMERVVGAQSPVLALVKVAGDRVAALRSEASKVVREQAP